MTATEEKPEVTPLTESQLQDIRASIAAGHVWIALGDEPHWYELRAVPTVQGTWTLKIRFWSQWMSRNVGANEIEPVIIETIGIALGTAAKLQRESMN